MNAAMVAAGWRIAGDESASSSPRCVGAGQLLAPLTYGRFVPCPVCGRLIAVVVALDGATIADHAAAPPVNPSRRDPDDGNLSLW